MNNTTQTQDVRTIQQIDAEIADVKSQLNDLRGTQTEVYARIVGYYRAVKNWNKGKLDEFQQRKMFSMEDSSKEARGTEQTFASQQTHDRALTKPISSDGISYELFARKTCPNCPPVKNFMAASGLPGKIIDVDTEEGLKEAAEKEIFSSPTVIFYDNAGKEAGRARNVEEIKSALRLFFNSTVPLAV